MILCFPMILRDRRIEIEARWEGDFAEVDRITDCETLDLYEWEFTEEEEYRIQETAASEAASAETMPDPDDLPSSDYYRSEDGL